MIASTANSRPALAARVVPALVAAAYLMSPGPASAQAGAWLERALSVFDRAPFQLEYTVSMSADQGQTQVRMESRGTFLYLDTRHSVSRLETSLQAGGAAPRKSTSHTIADGEHSWAFSVAEGQPAPAQILRSALDELEARAASEGITASTSGDPLTQLRALAPAVDLRLEAEDGDSVTLQGSFGSDLPSSLAAQLQAFGSTPRLTLRVDKASGEPRTMTLGPAGQPMLRVEFQPVSYLTRDQVPADSFAFTPPTGVPILSP